MYLCLYDFQVKLTKSNLMCTALPDLSQVFYNKVTNSSLPYTEIGALLSLESLVAL